MTTKRARPAASSPKRRPAGAATRANTMVIGDNPATDLRGAADFGLRALLVSPRPETDAPTLPDCSRGWTSRWRTRLSTAFGDARPRVNYGTASRSPRDGRLRKPGCAGHGARTPMDCAAPHALQRLVDHRMDVFIVGGGQPTTGVMASMTPKMRPVRSASDQRGFSSAAPLPIAATKASVDIASTSKAMETRFRWGSFSTAGRA